MIGYGSISRAIAPQAGRYATSEGYGHNV